MEKSCSGILAYFSTLNFDLMVAMRPVLLFSIVLCTVSIGYTQVIDSKQLSIPDADLLYGVDSVHEPPSPIFRPEESTKARSVPKAFAMSAVIPGLGQVYNGSYWKAGIAVAVEATLIFAYVSWKGKGNDGTDEYQAYAHGNWSPNRYAEWLNAYSGYGGAQIPLSSLTDEQFMHPEDWTAAQQGEATTFFNAIRAAERQSVYLSTGAGFSHVLPYFGEQQYYELIGKYFQFAPGWDDYTYEPDADPQDVMASDAKFYYYAGIHADANDYLRKASWAGAFVFVNHFAAAVEAAVSAKLHNMSLRPRTAMQVGPTGELLTTAGLVVDF